MSRWAVDLRGKSPEAQISAGTSLLDAYLSSEMAALELLLRNYGAAEDEIQDEVGSFLIKAALNQEVLLGGVRHLISSGGGDRDGE